MTRNIYTKKGANPVTRMIWATVVRTVVASLPISVCWQVQSAMMTQPTFSFISSTKFLEACRVGFPLLLVHFRHILCSIHDANLSKHVKHRWERIFQESLRDRSQEEISSQNRKHNPGHVAHFCKQWIRPQQTSPESRPRCWRVEGSGTDLGR